VYEDSILVKLWSVNPFRADDLLAQGVLSFIELRNNPLQPARWFNLYGWDPNEISEADLKQITASTGEFIKPNFYKGSLLISGRVDRLDSFEELQQAKGITCKTCVEPPQTQRFLLGDVYEVVGGVGKECCVEVTCGHMAVQTKFVNADWTSKEDASHSSSKTEREEDREAKTHETAHFSFKQEEGRLEPLLLMLPEDRESRPDVMINVYTRGVLSAQQRIGYQTQLLHDIGQHEPGNPPKPKFIQLEPMPFNVGQTSPASVLMVLEQSTSQIQKIAHARIPVKPYQYLVRAYVFMARAIDTQHPQDFSLRVDVAGVSTSTKKTSKEVRPMWMQVVELPVWYFSDNQSEPPTVEPITVSLVEGSGPLKRDIAKASCRYEYLRKRDSMKVWEPYELNPQWIELYGGQYKTKVKAEVLIAYEMMYLKDDIRKELPPKAMWPVSSDFADTQERPFCRNRKCTLHFSLLGLRDITMPKDFQNHLGTAASLLADHLAPEPEVVVQIKKFQEGVEASDKYYEMKFSYTRPDDNQRPKLKTWETKNTAGASCMNYEMFQTKKMNIMLPDALILQPFINVKVNSMVRGAEKLNFKPSLVGEHRRGLTNVIPCTWYSDEINPLGNYEAQKPLIMRHMKNANQGQIASVSFQEETKEDREKRLAEYREREVEQSKQTGAQEAQLKEDEELPQIGAAGVPRQFEPHNPITNPSGLRPGTRQPLGIGLQERDWDRLNVNLGTRFSPRDGADVKKKDGARLVPYLRGKLETRKHGHSDDFHFKGQPLLLNRDIIDPEDDSVDWYYENTACFGFVKCLFKLTEGWEDEEVKKGKKKQEAISEWFEKGIAPIKSKFPGWFAGKKAESEALTLPAEESKLPLMDNEGTDLQPRQEDEAPIPVRNQNWSEERLKHLQRELQSLREKEKIGQAGVQQQVGEKNPAFEHEENEMIKIFSEVKLIIMASTPKKKQKEKEKEKAVVPDTPSRKALPPSSLEVGVSQEPQATPNGQDATAGVGDALAAFAGGAQAVAGGALYGAAAVAEGAVAATTAVAQGTVQGAQAIGSVFAEEEKPIQEFTEEEKEIQELTHQHIDFNEEDLVKDLAWPMVSRAGLFHEIQECENWLKTSRRARDNDPSRILCKDILETFRNMEQLATTFGYNPAIGAYAFDEKKLYEKYLEVPPRLRLRIYFQKAICVSGLADAYIKYTIGGPGGPETVSLRNQPEYSTNTPQFYRTEERDIVLPQGGKLSVTIWDLNDGPLETDTEIGGTVIDLEDRWHSGRLRDAWDRGATPREERPLYKSKASVGRSRGEMAGSLEMFVEMIDTVMASERRAVPLAKPKPSEIEMRLVIWECEIQKFPSSGQVDAKVGIQLQCNTWLGEDRQSHFKLQKTDTHNRCTGVAKFSWRIVYPRIVLPTKSCNMTIDLYQAGVLIDDEVLASTTLDVRKYVEKVGSTMDQIHIEQQKLPLNSPSEDEEGAVAVLLFDMWIMPQTEASQNRVGVGQSEPNEHPQLIRPTEGRTWGDVIPAVAFQFAFGSFYKKVLPVVFIGILFALLSLVALKQAGLL